MDKLHHFINGNAVKLSNGRSGPVFNPSSGEQIAEVPYADEDTTNEAIAAAKSAFPEWASTPSVQRARFLFKFLELMNRHKEEIAQIVTREHGKTIPDAIGSITRGLEVVEFACGIPQVLKGEFSENVGTDIDSWSIRQPVGICAGITPLISLQWFQCGCFL